MKKRINISLDEETEQKYLNNKEFAGDTII